jgi:PAS domain S-box-containing protein
LWFFREGVRGGEQCLCITNPEHADELNAGGLAADTHLEPGAVAMLTARVPYTCDGQFDSRAMLKLWRGYLAAGRAAGFTGLRVLSDMGWVFGPEVESELIREYEALLRKFLPNMGAIRVICPYVRSRFPPDMIAEVLRAHPLAIVNDHVYTNPYFDPAAPVPDSPEGARQRLEWMLSQLESRRRRDAAVVELSRLALEASSVADLVNAVAPWIAAELSVNVVEIFELLRSADALRLVASVGLPQVAPGSLAPVDPNGPLGSGVLRARQPLIITDWSQESRFRQAEVLRTAGNTTSVSVVIGTVERVYGVLSAHAHDPRIFSEDDVLFLERVALLLGHGMARHHAEEDIRAMVDNASDVICRFDEGLRVIYVNPAIERATGLPAESYIGHSSRDWGMAEGVAAGWELVLRQAWRARREQTTEFTLVTARGERYFQCRVVPELGADGSVQSLLAISRDITELHSAQAEREQLYRELASRDRHERELQEQLLSAERAENQRLRRATLLAELTPRERDVLRLIAQGKTNREIGQELHLSPGTVKNHVARLLPKLGAVDRTQAAARASEFGFSSEPEQ